MYKSSNYNIFIPYENGHLVYNTLSCALLNFHESIYKNVKNILLNPNNYYQDKNFNILKNNGLIISKNTDELSQIYTVNEKVKNSNDILALQIFPNFDCNFNCSYCYEDKIKEHLSGNNLEKVKKLLTNISSNVKTAKVTWMGGEPLLSWTEIKILSEPLLQIPDYSASLITNGYGFSDKIINELFDNKIYNIQITLDGFSEIHNKRRNCPKPVDSYGIIKSNIDKIIKKYGNKIKLTINTNLDYTNLDSYFELIDDLQAYKKLVNVSISRTQYISNKNEIPIEQFLSIQKNLYAKISKKGFLSNVDYLSSEYRNIGCYCELNNGFIIGHDACIYKCSTDVNNQKMVGVILENGEIKNNETSEFKFWQHYSLKNNADCSVCSYLPMCMGGCPINHSEILCKAIKSRINNRIILAYEKN